MRRRGGGQSGGKGAQRRVHVRFCNAAEHLPHSVYKRTYVSVQLPNPQRLVQCPCSMSGAQCCSPHAHVLPFHTPERRKSNAGLPNDPNPRPPTTQCCTYGARRPHLRPHGGDNVAPSGCQDSACLIAQARRSPRHQRHAALAVPSRCHLHASAAATHPRRVGASCGWLLAVALHALLVAFKPRVSTASAPRFTLPHRACAAVLLEPKPVAPGVPRKCCATPLGPGASATPPAEG